jgi:hypothetical protein
VFTGILAQRGSRSARAELAGKSETVSDLSIPIGSLYQLAAPSTPEPVRQAAFEAIANGEKVTPGHIREMVRIAKPILEDQGDGDGDEHKAKMRYEPTIPVLSLCACAQRVLTQCGDA